MTDKQKLTTGANSFAQQAGGDIYNKDPEDLGIIGEIFENLFERQKNGETVLTPIGTPTKLQNKINLNFDGHEKDVVVETFLSEDMVRRKGLVEDYLRTASETRQDDVSELVSMIKDYFREVKKSGANVRTRVEEYSVLYEMAKKLLPESNAKNPKFQRNSIAIVSYFFEECEFGTKE